MIKNKKTLITILVLIILSVISFIIFRKLRDNYRLENAGIPYADERTISISIIGDNKFSNGEKILNLDDLTKYLNSNAAENGLDIPVVIKFGLRTMNQDLDISLSPIFDTGFYNLYFLYNPENKNQEKLLAFHPPCPDGRRNNFFIFFPGKQANSEDKYRVLLKEKSDSVLYGMTMPSDGIDSVKKINKNKLFVTLSKHTNSVIALVCPEDFISVKSFLDLLYICNKAGCSAPTMGYLDPEYRKSAYRDRFYGWGTAAELYVRRRKNEKTTNRIIHYRYSLLYPSNDMGFLSIMETQR